MRTLWPHRQSRLPAAVCCAALLLLAWPVTALAQYPPTSSELTTSTSEASPGDPVTVSGDGFQPGTEVAITFESTPVLLATVRADAAGRFSTVVRIPMDATPGEHTLKATGLGADGRVRVLSARIFIRGTGPTVAVAPAATPATPRGPLSITGLANLGMIVGIALVLMLLGLLMVARRRRREPAG